MYKRRIMGLVWELQVLAPSYGLLPEPVQIARNWSLKQNQRQIQDHGAYDVSQTFAI